ncbi:T9SS type A sorting domain-containing protein [Polluticaenibacter yanchengensis]|uniref:T9SS type A sorting domain-containing protein n=1 Tax=Polluticaenibacter yanchengensis TaxID=3014562 RepID=A0ABT4UNI2_9BACT|nr:T9SS type A sorting domain-containing protein [Chitinophagaceae bacterium LY-5]
MKKLFIFSALILSVSLSFAQTWQATIKKGTQTNSVKLFLKASEAITNQYLNSLEFAILIPATVNPQPEVKLLSNSISHLTWEGFPAAKQVSDETFLGKAFKSYYFRADGSNVANNNFPATEFEAVEIILTGAGLTDVYLAQLPDGGSTGFVNFYLATNIKADANDVNPFYGSGSFNDGKGYSGESYVKLTDVDLPVNFMSFYALKASGASKLVWDVENDINNQYFEIERSEDGRNYSKIGSVNAKANGKSSNSYEFLDNGFQNANAASVYYRIKQVDKDGAVTYSVIRTLKIDKNALLNLFPNPVKSVTKLSFDSKTEYKASILVRDISGKIVLNKAVLVNKGVNNFDINLQNVAAGEYNVTLLSPAGSENIKLTKIQ